MVKKILLWLVIIIFAVGSRVISSDDRRKGRLAEEIVSEDGTKVLNIYTGPPEDSIMVDDGVLGEIVDRDTNKKKTIYFEYHNDEAEAVWIDNETVCINGRILNIEKDYYNADEGEDTTWPNVVKGKYVDTVESPNKRYKANIYCGVADDSVMTGSSAAVEIENVEENKKQIVYYSYDQIDVQVYWSNDETLIVDGEEIDAGKLK